MTNFPIQGILDHLVRRIVDILPVTAAGVTSSLPAMSRGTSLRRMRRRSATRSCRANWTKAHASRPTTAGSLYQCLICGSLIAAQTLADVAAAYLINAQARSDLQDSSDQHVKRRCTIP